MTITFSGAASGVRYTSSMYIFSEATIPKQKR